MNKRFRELGNQLAWTHLAVKHQSSNDLLLFALDEHSRLQDKTMAEKKKWTEKSMLSNRFNGLEFWLNHAVQHDGDRR